MEWQSIQYWFCASVRFGKQHEGIVWTCLGAFLFFLAFRIWYKGVEDDYNNPKR